MSELYSNNLDLYSNLTAYGHFCPTKLHIRNPQKFVAWTEENFTYADLSEVHTTQDLIKEVLLYSKKHPQFDNQIAWLHAAKALSQKWPCKKNGSK